MPNDSPDDVGALGRGAVITSVGSALNTDQSSKEDTVGV